MAMTSGLWTRSVKHSPAGGGGYAFSGRARPILTTCRFGPNRPPANASLRACSAPSSTIATANRPLPPPSPPSDLATSPIPLLLIPPILVDKNQYHLKEDDPYIFYSLYNNQIVTVEKNQISWRRDEIRDAHWVGSSKGWVMFMNRSDCNLYLCNPFSPAASPIIPLPPIETLPAVASRHFRRRRSDPDDPEPTSLEMDHEFAMEDWYNKRNPEDPYNKCSREERIAYYEEKTKKKWFEVPLPSPFEPNVVSSEDLITKGFIHKMILSCAPPSPSNEYKNECFVAIIYGRNRTLAICRLGDSSWTRLDGVRYQEIAFSRHDGSYLYTWDHDSYDMKSCNLSNPKSPGWNVITNLYVSSIGFKYLVESATEPGKVLVISDCDANGKMEVYEVDIAKKSYERVESLDDQALFVGDFSEAMSVIASELPPQVKPNCVYFTDFYYFQTGLFDLEKRVVNYGFEGLDLDPSIKGEMTYDVDYDYCERPGFRKEGEGWPVWVMPSRW